MACVSFGCWFIRGEVPLAYVMDQPSPRGASTRNQIGAMGRIPTSFRMAITPPSASWRGNSSVQIPAKRLAQAIRQLGNEWTVALRCCLLEQLPGDPDQFLGSITSLASNVTAVCANARPVSTAPVFSTIAVPPKMIPRKLAAVPRVVWEPTCQKTFLA